MRALLAASLLATLALVPAAAADDGCWDRIPGLCVDDPCDGPVACQACTRLVDACVDLEACFWADLGRCVDVVTYCLHDACPPHW